MSKVDGRKVSHKVREGIRIKAIGEWLKGLGSTALAKKYGTSKKIIHDWINRYKEGGFEGLKTRTGTPGTKSRLISSHREELGLLLRTKTPEDYGYQSLLWTSAIIADVIQQEFGVIYAASSVNRILKQMGFSPQKPCRKAWQQDKKKWMNG